MGVIFGVNYGKSVGLCRPVPPLTKHAHCFSFKAVKAVQKFQKVTNSCTNEIFTPENCRTWHIKFPDCIACQRCITCQNGECSLFPLLFPIIDYCAVIFNFFSKCNIPYTCLTIESPFLLL